MRLILQLIFIMVLMVTNSFGFPPVLSLLGTGFDKISKTEKLKCVVANKIVSQDFNNKPSYSIQHVSTLGELKQALGFEAQASLGTGIYEHNQKVKYLNSGRLNSYESFMVVKVEIKNQIGELTQYNLNEMALDLLAEKEKGAFFQNCGNEFVVSQLRGRQLIALVTFYSDSQRDRDWVREVVRQDMASFQLTGEFSAQMRNLASTLSYGILVFRRDAPQGGFKFEHLADEVRSFAEQTNVSKKVNPWVIQAVTVPYFQVDNFSKNGFDLSSLENQDSFLEELAQIKDRLLMNEGNILYVINNKDNFLKVNLEEWEHLRRVNERDLFRVKDLVRACVKNPKSNCHFGVERFEISQLALPVESGETASNHSLADDLQMFLSELEGTNKTRSQSREAHWRLDECCLM